MSLAGSMRPVSAATQGAIRPEVLGKALMALPHAHRQQGKISIRQLDRRFRIVRRLTFTIDTRHARRLSHRAAEISRRNPPLKIGFSTGLESPPAKRGKDIKRRKLSVHKFREFMRYFRPLCKANKDGRFLDLSRVTPPSFPLPIWEQLTDEQRAVIFTMAARARFPSCAFAFSFNIDPTRLGRQKRKLKYIRERLTSEMDRRGISRRFPLAMGLHSQKETGVEIHVHGCIILDENFLGAFNQALLAVGGEWRPIGHRGREMQTHVILLDKDKEDGDGFTWGSYFVEESSATRALLIALGDLKANTISISHSARPIAREFFEEIMEFGASEIDWIAGSAHH